ncbi:MAG TPA: FAD-binding protein [Bacteroidia bacterium]|nr:FAD-binding protein [Bacteroidia bacterium]
MNSIVDKLKDAFKSAGVATPDILFNCSDKETQIKYDDRRKVFNRQFDFMPTAIVMCENTEQVSTVVNFINTNKDENGNQLQLRVRSGGHDHEGECSATGVVLIDLSQMVAVNIQEERVHIQPGIQFKDLTSKLADKDVMIPHGTCGTVAIAGFTMGGGWGPWTRKHGMCCESLIAVTVVLGDGTVVKLKDADYKWLAFEDYDYMLDDEKGLLWAIKGGGGFSYGIVTEFVIKTFPLPAEIIKFEIRWNELVSFAASEARTGKKLHVISQMEITTEANKKETRVLALGGATPTLSILDAWEKAIMSKEPDNKDLVGTNLQVIARALEGNEKFDAATAVNQCTMYGYWEGTEQALRKYAETYFSTGRLTNIQKAGRNYKVREVVKGGKKIAEKINYGDNLMSEWDRFSFHNVNQILRGLEATPFPPDSDTPGPHKISSRLANAGGLKIEGRTNLLDSLFSSLIFQENIAMGLSTYITLGAISGDYYNWGKEDGKSSFPYRDKQYTIQYQTWWTEPRFDATEADPKSEVNENVNRALDWMQVCRDYKIANTSGSFISFKDSSIPTQTYFAQSYDSLVKVKQDKSKDPLNHFRSRKTIV